MLHLQLSHADQFKAAMEAQNRASYEAHKRRMADAERIADIIYSHDPAHAYEILESALYRLQIQPSELSDWSHGD